MSFVDICLTCEKHTSGAAYCSQSCRLQDIDGSSTSSTATSPTYSLFPAAVTTPQQSNPSGNRFFLPPPIDWSALRSTRNPGATAGQRSNASRPASMYALPTTTTTSRSHRTRAPSSPRGLTPSSSQASLSSMKSNMFGGDQLSRQAREELREYTSSFDQVRDLRRRMTTT